MNVARLIARRDTEHQSRFRSPGLTPALSAALCLFLVGPWVERGALVDQIAGGLILLGILLLTVTWMTNRGMRAKTAGFRDIDLE